MSFNDFPPAPTAPNRYDPDTFASNSDAFFGYIEAQFSPAVQSFVASMNAILPAVQNAESYATQAESYKNSAEVSAAAAQSAAGLPSLTSSAGKALVVNASEDGVEWGSVGAKNYTLDVNESVQVLSGAVDKDVAILSAGNPFFVSNDNLTWYLQDSYSERVNGDLYISNSKEVGFVDFAQERNASVILSYLIGTISNGDYFVCTSADDIIKLDSTGAVIQSDTLTYGNNDKDIKNTYIYGDQLHIVTLDGTIYYYPTNDLTAPSTKTFKMQMQVLESVSYGSGSNIKGTSTFIANNHLYQFGAAYTFTNNGSYLIGLHGSKVKIWQLSIPYDLDTADLIKTSWLPDEVGTVLSNSSQPFMKPDGTRFFVMDEGSGRIHQYDLATPFDITTATHAGFGSTLASTYPQGSLSFSSDGSKYYFYAGEDADIRQVTLNTPWDITTQSNAYDLPASTVGYNPSRNIAFSENGDQLYFVGTDSISLGRVPLTTPWDLSTYDVANKELIEVANSLNIIQFYMVYATENAVYFGDGVSLEFSTPNTIAGGVKKTPNVYQGQTVYELNVLNGTVVNQYQVPELPMSPFVHMPSVDEVVYSTGAEVGYKHLTTGEQFVLDRSFLGGRNETPTLYGLCYENGAYYASIYLYNNVFSTKIYPLTGKSGAIVFGA